MTVPFDRTSTKCLQVGVTNPLVAFVQMLPVASGCVSKMFFFLARAHHISRDLCKRLPFGILRTSVGSEGLSFLG